MSPVECSSPRRRNFNRTIALATLLTSAPAAWAQSPAPAAAKPAKPLPSELAAFAIATAPWQLQGTGALRFFGFKAYDANLWVASAAATPPTATPVAAKSQFALEIVYNTSIKGEEIVNVSLVEMARLRKLNNEQVRSWTAEMKKSFPNVVAGDRLTGVYLPSSGTRFFFNGKLVSEISDPLFGDAFFAIWLDEQTKRSELRRQLLGLPAVAQSQSQGQGQSNN
jgi:Chalcone isomerase-like